MPDNTLSRLSNIRIKIRRLTKSPSTAQLTDETIDSYVNTFILYDMPPDVSLNSLKTVLRFNTDPFIESYSTNTDDVDDPLYNFKNNYTLASNSTFIDGSLTYWTDSRSDFYNLYPRPVVEESIGTGNDVLDNFTGTLDGFPVLENTVVFGSKDIGDNYMKLYDDGEGNITGDGDGDIDYITGVYDVTFNAAPATGEDVYCRRNSYTPSKPLSMLYFQDTFYLRPIPNKSYSVEVEVFQRPTELMDAGDLPDLSQWWEFIAFGSARKILMDMSDFEGASMLEVEMEKQRENVLYKTVIQNTIKEGYGL